MIEWLELDDLDEWHGQGYSDAWTEDEGKHDPQNGLNSADSLELDFEERWNPSIYNGR